MSLDDRFKDIDQRLLRLQLVTSDTKRDTTLLLERMKPQAITADLTPTFKELSDDDMAIIVRLMCNIRDKHKIEAIRELRQLTGCGLKEAKDIIEIALP